jgi:photosystem II stability/assembly factor-like uncharacterized protein
MILRKDKCLPEGWRHRWLIIMLVAVPAIGLAGTAKTAGDSRTSQGGGGTASSAAMLEALQNLEFRNIGPAIMGGRVDDFAVVEDDPNTIYVGTAAGGVFKSVNGGTTWTPIFDHAISSSIGAIAIAPSDPSIVWVGTGEANNRQSASWGAGIYKSLDAGNTWTFMGLENTSAIGRVAIDPRNPEVVYVAALGDQWGPNRERGVYKTTDGGKTWTQSLAISENTGVSDVAIDPSSPGTVYAAAYERRRTVWGFNGGGPEGGIYKTTDGGANWTKLSKDLPYADGSDVGRIGISIYRRNPEIVYVRLQHAKGGIFRSEDKGASWTRMSDFDPRPNYFGGIAVDPNNDLRIWVGGTDMFHSEDGGKTFDATTAHVHYDNHALWIDPHDSNHVMIGVDGGIFISRDGGRSWDHDNNVAIAQFYEVTTDNQVPYRVCGGLQDNGSWCGPSNSLQTRGIINADWLEVSGADGMHNRLDPQDPNVDYVETQDGALSRRDFRTTETHSIRPRPKEGEAPYRFQWNSPIEVSAHDHNTIYFGGNFLFKSTNRGDMWVKISPDLTNGEDRSKLQILGKLPTREELSRNDGVAAWPCITVIGESPLNANLIYVGTDDGNLQVTRDGGKSWSNVAGKIPGLAHSSYVSRVVPSRYSEGTAYAAFDDHRNGDFHVYLYATTDYGQTWRAISNGISEKDGTVHVVREDPKVASILYAGTERGLFISYDRGEHWSRVNLNLPTVPVDDIQIHPRDNDLILGTHGRSIWILDDITPLQQMNAQVLNSNLLLFDVRPAYLFRTQNDTPPGFGFGWRMFQGQNPPYGALIDFYAKSAAGADQGLTISITDSTGKPVRAIRCVSAGATKVSPAPAQEPSCTLKAGVNRVAWDLRYDAPAPPEPSGAAGEGRGGGFGGPPRGPLVEPGEYTVKITLGSDTQTKPVRVEEDPRIQISDADRKARHEAIMKIYELQHGVTLDQRRVNALKTELDALMASWKRAGAPKIPDEVTKAAQDFSKKIDAVRANYTALPQEELTTPLPPTWPTRVGQMATLLEGYTAAPTPDVTEEIALLEKEVPEGHEQVQKLIDEDLANFNKAMDAAGVPFLTPPTGAGSGRGGRN